MSNAGAGRLQLRGDEMLPGNKRDHQPMSTTSILALLVSTLQRARGQAASITVCVSVSAGQHVLGATIGMRGTSRHRSTSVSQTRPRPQWTGEWQSRSRIQESLPPAPPTWGAL